MAVPFDLWRTHAGAIERTIALKNAGTNYSDIAKTLSEEFNDKRFSRDNVRQKYLHDTKLGPLATNKKGVSIPASLIEPRNGYAKDAIAPPKPSHPKGWEPHVEMEDGNGTVVFCSGTDENVDDAKILQGSDLDPARYRIVGPRKFKKWSTNAAVRDAEGRFLRWDAVWNYYHAVSIVEVDPTDRVADAKELISEIRTFKRSKVEAPAGTVAFAVAIADLQIGKSDGDGTNGTVRRFLDVIEKTKDRVRDLRKIGVPLGPLYILGLGDLIENCSSDWYAQQTFNVQLNLRDQIKLARRMFLHTLRELSPKFEKVVVAAVGGNHGECFAAGTELLTRNGWVAMEHIAGTEEIATLHPDTKAFEWQMITHWTQYENTEPMTEFENVHTSLLVTNNHDLYATKKNAKAWPRIAGSVEWAKMKPEEVSSRGATLGALHAADSFVGTAPSEIILPGYTASNGRIVPDVRLTDMRMVARLVGWYISEGWADPEGGRVCICQNAEINPENYSEIVEMIRALGFTPRERWDMVRFGSTLMARWLNENFGHLAYRKRIPAWVKEWPKELLEELMRSMLLGDGHKYSEDGWQLKTASDTLIDDIQEVCAKIGLRTVSEHERSFYRFAGTDYSGTAGGVYINKRIVTEYGEGTTVHYQGTVYCPTVPNGLVFVRRNGRVTVSGNSRKDGASYTSFGDNMDVGLVEMAEEVLSENPDAFGHVSFSIPQDRLDMTLDVCGTITGLCHGHQFGKGMGAARKAEEWWKGQAHGGQPIGDATLLLSGHYHHFLLTQMGKKTHIQAPAMEGGSEWYRNVTGMESPPGLLTLTIGAEHPRGWDNVAILQ